MAEPEEIAAVVAQALAERSRAPGARHGSLDGVRVLVTAGGTREPLDAVRFVGNRSSGRMGVAIAARGGGARRRASRSSPRTSRSSAPAGVEVVRGPTAADLAREALERAARRRHRDGSGGRGLPAGRSGRGQAAEGRRALEDRARADARRARALGAARRAGQVLVAFGAEHGEEGLERKRRMLTDKNVDLVVFNDVARDDIGFDATRTRSCSCGPAGSASSPRRRRPRSPPRCWTRSSACGSARVSDAATVPDVAGVALLGERVVANLAAAVHAPAETLRLPLVACWRRATCSSRTCRGSARPCSRGRSRARSTSRSSASSSRRTCCRRT